MFSRKVNWTVYVPAFPTSLFAAVIMMKVIGVWNSRENNKNKNVH
jgi:Na+/glutamate symporter